MLLCYITDRCALPGDLLEQISRAAAAGVDLIQLREKDLSARPLEELALGALDRIAGTQTRLLINGRCDIAIASGAHGVHLPAGEIAASEARAAFVRAAARKPFITVSCHSTADALSAWSHGADAALFAPVFAKQGAAVPSAQLEELARACKAVDMPVLALGGISLANAPLALQHGAAGVAGISLFQEGDIKETVRQLRQLSG